MSTDEFLSRIMFIFPETRKKKEDHIKEYEEFLPFVFLEDDVMPCILELFTENGDKVKTRELFDFFEKVSNEADENLLNLFSVTVLEILGNEDNILRTAQCFMGPQTLLLQKKADVELGRIR